MEKITDIYKWRDLLIQSNLIVIVEGKKDKKSLQNIGVSAEQIITLNKPIYAVVEHVATTSKKAIILTDIDTEGEKLHSLLKINLTTHGVQIEDIFRKYLYKEKISHIEGVDSYIERKMNLLTDM